MISDEARAKMGWRKGLRLAKLMKPCKVCGKMFETVPSSAKQHTCSMACAAERKKVTRVKHICVICSKDFTDLKTRSRKYCGTVCKIEGLARARRARFENKGLWGEWCSPRDAKAWYIKEHGACQTCGWKDEIGVLELHHRDRNRRHNTGENIMLLCPNCHSIEHLKNKDGQYKNNLGVKKCH